MRIRDYAAMIPGILDGYMDIHCYLDVATVDTIGTQSIKVCIGNQSKPGMVLRTLSSGNVLEVKLEEELTHDDVVFPPHVWLTFEDQTCYKE